MKRLVIGIDPGENNGVFYSVNGRLVKCETLDFYSLIMRLDEIKGFSEYNKKKIYIEDPNINKPVFLPTKMKQDIFKRKTNCLDGKPFKEQDLALRIAMRKAQNVGMNKQLAKLLIEFCKKKGFIVEMIRPGNKKLSADEFRRLSGFKGSTNQHVRDAGMLILGR